MFDPTWFKRKLKQRIIDQVRWDDLNAELDADRFDVRLIDTSMKNSNKFVVRVIANDYKHYFEVIVKEVKVR